MVLDIKQETGHNFVSEKRETNEGKYFSKCSVGSGKDNRGQPSGDLGNRQEFLELVMAKIYKAIY
jgi:hypothetical protein